MKKKMVLISAWITVLCSTALMAETPQAVPTPGVSLPASKAPVKHHSKKSRWKKKKEGLSGGVWKDPQQEVSDQTEVSEQSDHRSKKRKK